MTIWIVLTAMIAMAGAALAVALVRRLDDRPARLGDSEALNLKLADIEAQAATGALPRETADGLRAETIRRFLAEESDAKSPARPLGRVALSVMAVVVAGLLALGAALLYGKLGRPDLANPVAAQLGPDQGGLKDPTNPAVQLAATIAQLEAKARAAPGDEETLKTLGAAFMAAGRFGDSAAAYARAARLAPQDGEALSAEGEALAKAADGAVTPQAKAVFEAALAADTSDPRARYFLGAYKDQQGDHAGAMADWIALLKSAPPGAPWVPQVRGFVEQAAAQNHIDISGQLPPAPSSEPGPATDPAAAAQIRQMDPAAQKAMIQSMVGRLADRLKANPKDRDGWINLMRARLVLGDFPGAATAYHDALAGDPADRSALTAAAKQLGVPGA
jgi:cytochrome c-type biogenesis protein CcmH